MISLILRTATRFLLTLLLLFSLFLLLRGHNHPGGGFVGGLVAAAAFALYTIAYDVTAARRALWFEPRTLMATGLLAATGTGLAALAARRPFLTALWGTVELADPVAVGTPLLFDAGVYLVVLGATLTIVFSLSET